MTTIAEDLWQNYDQIGISSASERDTVNVMWWGSSVEEGEYTLGEYKFEDGSTLWWSELTEQWYPSERAATRGEKEKMGE